VGVDADMTTVSPNPAGGVAAAAGSAESRATPKHVQRIFIGEPLPAEALVIREERRAGA